MQSITSIFEASGEKENCLVQAVVQNNVELLNDLLDSSKWFNTTDSQFGYNLLQIAICLERKEVFDYLLSLPGYPLEFKNKFRETALKMSFSRSSRISREYFTCELIKKGASTNRIYNGYTLLHKFCKKGCVKASMLLIEKGADVNVSGSSIYTPLQYSCGNRNNDLTTRTEIILMLLEFGADTSLRDNFGYTPFEDSVNIDLPNEVQEALFYYTYDEFSLLEIHLDTLLKLAAKDSPLFYEIIKHQFEIIVERNKSTIDSCLKYLQSIKSTDLITLITEFDTSFKIFFAQLSKADFEIFMSIEKLNILVESSLKYEFINIYIPFICTLLPEKIKYSQDESELTEYICYLLSYGIEIEEEYLYLIYKKFGYCGLFKILLHMDIKNKNSSCSSYIFPRLLINITENLENILNNTNHIPSNELREVMNYFVHPKLHSMYREENPEENINVSNVPLLLELARNVFRSYFIDKFQIKTSRTFYTLLNSLKISSVHKRFITYETKLYSI